MKLSAPAAALALSALPFLLVLPGGLDGFVGVVAEDAPIPGDSDVYEQAWHFWWVGRSVAEGTDPRVCPLIGLPAPYSLIGQNIGWPDALMFGTISQAHPETAVFLSLLFGTLLVTCAGFLFARSWGLGPLESALASVLMAWAPARMAHLIQHYQIAGFGWVLLSMALIRMYLCGRRTALLALSGLSLVLASMESAYHTLSGAMGILLVAAATIVTRRVEGRRVAAASAFFAAAMLLSFLFFDSFPGPMPPRMGIGDAAYWSAEPLSLLLPSPFGMPWVLSGADPRMPWMPNVFEGVVTPGLMVLLLAMFALLGRGSHDRTGEADPRGVRLLALFSLLPFTLALGPWLKFMGNPVGIPMPYSLLHSIPLLEGVKSPSRFAILGACMLIVPAAHAIRSLGRRGGIVFALLALFEAVPPGLPTISSAIPPIYSEDHAGGPVLEIPATMLARRHGYFMTADGNERPVFFLVRRIEGLSARFDPFLIDSPDTVSVEDALATGVEAIYYNRWLYDAAARDELDSRFAALFPGASPGDSVRVWRR